MELGILRNKKVHKKKCNKHVTLMVIPDTTKKPFVVKVPKWIRFPLFILLIAIVLGAFYLVDYTARLEYQTVADRHVKQTDVYAIEDRDVEIESLEATNEDHYAKLQELEALQVQLEAHLADIQAYKEELDSIVNSTEKTTTEQPSELEEVQEASPITTLDGRPIDEIEEDEGDSSESMTYQEMETYNASFARFDSEVQNFNAEYEVLLESLNAALDELSVEQDDYELLDEELEIIVPFWESYPSGWPVNDSYIQSVFGWRIHPVSRVYKFHYGLDLQAYYEPVYATGKGTVIRAEYYSGYGYCVDIDHGYGYVTRYAHLSSFEVEVGDEVVRGQQIATSGNSGVSTGPHLHYEVHKDGVKIDPEPFL